MGSGGKGTIVLDDLVVKQISEAQEDSEATTTVKTSDVMDVSNKTAVKQSCVLDKDQGDCSANFTRYYYSLTTDACLKVQFTYFILVLMELTFIEKALTFLFYFVWYKNVCQLERFLL